MLDPKASSVFKTVLANVFLLYHPSTGKFSSMFGGEVKRVQSTTAFHLLSGKIFAWKPLPKTRFSRLLKAWVEGIKEELLQQDRAGE